MTTTAIRYAETVILTPAQELARKYCRPRNHKAYKRRPFEKFEVRTLNRFVPFIAQ